ncbi:FAD linked oxidase [Rhizoctonia solani]|uniref:D-lactate dehydrogenase (cytochrome) n=1 Tax=Rhizoctonia solani TaxID=456999 RepID=A0A8H7M0A6_9AGAM|nr:FAD linked oxidase [Rhizoctonia solani]
MPDAFFGRTDIFQDILYNPCRGSSSQWSSRVPPLPIDIGKQTHDALVTPVYATKAAVLKAITELETLLSKDDVSTDSDVLKAHGFSDNSYHPSAPHSVVVLAHSTEDVVKIVKIANKYRIPVTAFSGGTNTRSWGICIDLSNMDHIISINEADSDMVVQSGAKWEDINHTLEDQGIPLFFPLDPGPGATIGGMIGTGCSGTNAVRYGTAKAEWFLNVTVVLPNGEVIKTRRRARKSSAGFDTTKLFIGAEGTLGIVTEGIKYNQYSYASTGPSTSDLCCDSWVLRCSPSSRRSAEILNKGVPIQCVELLDDHMMAAINKANLADRKYAEMDSLFFKFQGSPEAQKEASATIKKIVEKHGGKHFQAARDEKEASDCGRIGSMRFGVPWLCTQVRGPGQQMWRDVPVSRLPELVLETKKDLADSNLKSTIVGHVGDGNFHAIMIIRNAEELEPYEKQFTIGSPRTRLGRNLGTGEHGVGVGKKEYLVEELGPGTVELITVKRAIDPHNLFNPG